MRRKITGTVISTFLSLGLLFIPWIEQNQVYGADAPVAIDETNFPDEIFREYLNNYDLDNNGQLSVDEIQGVESIMVAQMGITDLTGLEYFNNLTTLVCYGNQLNSLDVSQNVLLKNLMCNGNQISSLDVSQNVELIALVCYENQLSSLDVSQNVDLKDLVCYENQLSSLDVSHNEALAVLICHENQLSSLDVSRNLNLERLICFGNQLSSLDVRRNTALEELQCGSNQLSSLDVSRNTSLTTLTCMDNQISVPLYQKDSEYYVDLSGLQLDADKVSDFSTGTYDSTTGHIGWQSLEEIGDSLTYQYDIGYQNQTMSVTVNISGDPIQVEEPDEEASTTEDSSGTEGTTTEQDPSQNTETSTTEQDTSQSTEVVAAGQGTSQNTEAAKPTQDTPKTGDAMVPVWIAILGLLSIVSYLVARKRSSIKQ